MKDSQQKEWDALARAKYIKANNERFSTRHDEDVLAV